MKLQKKKQRKQNMVKFRQKGGKREREREKELKL